MLSRQEQRILNIVIGLIFGVLFIKYSLENLTKDSSTSVSVFTRLWRLIGDVGSILVMCGWMAGCLTYFLATCRHLDNLARELGQSKFIHMQLKLKDRPSRDSFNVESHKKELQILWIKAFKLYIPIFLFALLLGILDLINSFWLPTLPFKLLAIAQMQVISTSIDSMIARNEQRYNDDTFRYRTIEVNMCLTMSSFVVLNMVIFPSLDKYTARLVIMTVFS